MYLIDAGGSPTKVVPKPEARRDLNAWPTLSSLSSLTDPTSPAESRVPTAPHTPKPRSSWHPDLAPRRGKPLTRSPDRIGGHGIDFWKDTSGVVTRGVVNGAMFAPTRPNGDVRARQLDQKEERALMATRQAYFEGWLEANGGGAGSSAHGIGLARQDTIPRDELGESMEEDGGEQQSSQPHLGSGDTIVIDHEDQWPTWGAVPLRQVAHDTIIIDEHQEVTPRQRAFAPRQGTRPLGLQPTEPVF